MARVSACEVPEGSLLAQYGGPGDYRDCFCREVPGEVTLGKYIERFYSSMAFAPERMILSLIGRAKGWDASADAIRALARGEADRFAAWEVVERTPDQILLLSKDTNTASWLSVEPTSAGIRLLFGSWVGGIDQSGWRVMLAPHVWYSRVLLGGC